MSGPVPSSFTRRNARARLTAATATLVVTLLVLFVACTTRVTYRINAGGPEVYPFAADVGFTGGTTASTTATIGTNSATNPAPKAVYQTQRTGTFSYTVGNLNTGSSYLVRLHFAELTATAAGQRKFNVTINGNPVLTEFDVFASSGAKNRAHIQEFIAPAAGNGAITIDFQNGSIGAPILNGLEVIAPYQVNAGGNASAPFSADDFFSGGSKTSTTANIDTTDVIDPAPEAVYRHARRGATTYTFPGLGATVSYRVRLHFAEISKNGAGLRRFDVAVNGLQVLADFDIFAEAGAKNKAIVREYRARSSGAGAVTVALSNGAVDVPLISAIEVMPDPAYQLDAGGPNVPPFGADDYFSGGSAQTTAAAIDLSLLTGYDPAPAAVYQSARVGQSTYTFTNLQYGLGYHLRLHFAEIVKTAAGQRKFDVVVRGETVLYNFDVWANASNPFTHPNGSNTAIVKDFFTSPDVNGSIVVQFVNASVDTPLVSGLELVPDTFLLINAGGGATFGFSGDDHYQGGTPVASTAAIDGTTAPNPAPPGVYQSLREGPSTYVIDGLAENVRGTPNHVWTAQYRVRLHFAELTATGAGQRRFDVTLNGAPALTDFDIFAAAGGSNKALVRDFTLPADADGRITIAFANGSAGEAAINGIEVYRLGAQQWAAADQLFHRDQQWRGGDGAASVNLGGGRVLWLFADSFVDTVPPYQRAGSSFVRNSIGLQTGLNPETATFKGYWQTNGGTPSDYFPPPPVLQHWYWPSEGTLAGARLVILATERSGSGAQADFVANVAFVVDNYALDPSQWTVTKYPLPATPGFSMGTIGAGAVMHEGSYTYIFGEAVGVGTFCPTSSLFLWRYSDAEVAAGDFSNPAFFTGPGPTFTPLAAMTGDPAPIATQSVQANVHKDVATGRYVITQGASCFGPLQARASTTKEGPWPAPITIQAPPESGSDQAFSTYLRKAHPWLEGVAARQVGVTYSTNHGDVFTNEQWYYPRFLKMFVP